MNSTLVLVEPVAANVMNASFVAVLVVGLLMSPKAFMEGGKFQAKWFDKLPESADSYIYYLGQVCGLVMLSVFVIPVFILPQSQWLCFVAVIMHGVMMLHFLAFQHGLGAYKAVLPTTVPGKVQWIAMLIGIATLFVISLLACLHQGPDLEFVTSYNSTEHILPIFPVNVAVASMSSLFSLFFVLVPTQMISTFWTDDSEPSITLCGFKQLARNGICNWWGRNVGLAFLSVNLSTIVNPIDGAETGLHHPLYTIMALCIMSLVTVFNANVLMMHHYKGIGYIGMSWIPNLVLGLGFVTLLVLTLVYK